MSELSKHFNLREGFSTFTLEPEKHPELLFGKKERELRDKILGKIADAAIGDQGYKAVNVGDFGVGKTHLSQNLIFEIKRKGFRVRPIYVRCWEFQAKDAFHRIFTEMLVQLGTKEINNAAIEYGLKARSGEALPWDQVVPESIAPVFDSLGSMSPQVVQTAIQWLGGSLSASLTGSGKMTPAQRVQIMAPDTQDIEVSRDFAAVMRGFVHLFAEPGCASEEGEILLFLIDEAERFKQVTQNDAYWSWIGCLRLLTEIQGLGMIFFAGAKDADDLPMMFIWEEVSTRIGHSNYHEFHNLGFEALKAWVEEFLQTLVQKGPVPKALREVLAEEVVKDKSLAEGIQKIVGKDPAARNAYPFTAECLESLIEGCMESESSNRPREVIKRIQSAATRATRMEEPMITEEILEATIGEGLL